MQYAIWKRELQYFAKNDPDESEVKNPNSAFLIQVKNFLRSFHRWKNENVQQRTNALFSWPFEVQLQVHIR